VAQGGAVHRTLHLVMVIADEPPPETVRTLHGLQLQTSGRWTLTVALRHYWHNTFTALLAVSGLQRTSQRVQVEATDDTSQPGELLWAGLTANEGADVALIFPGDVWAPDAVAQLAGALTPGGAVYADEDRLAGDDTHTAPRLKPSYSPEFLLASSYVGRPLAFGSQVVTHLLRTGGSSTADVEHDTALRVCEAASDVVHVPEVLCHRLPGMEDSDTTTPRPYSDTHIVAALDRREEVAEVRPGPVAGTYRVLRSIRSLRRASIIIAFRDEPRFLRSCIETIDATCTDHPVEIVLIDNGSVLPETATLLDRLTERPDLHLLADDRPFNWAALNNAAAEVATGDVLVFLNNDIEAHREGWLTALCTQALRSDVGAVGGRLLYPDHRLQHCGVVIGLGGAAGHLFVGLEEGRPGYLNMAVLARECAAVTGACLATRREVFDHLNGFDESLGVDLNDIDYCLRAQMDGLRVLFDPMVELIHHESPSRGTAGDVRDIVHFVDRWKTSILAGDPYLHPSLTRVDSSCALRAPDEVEWWHKWHATLFPS
jgi:O-antigen biosynthesis protein